MDDSLDVELSDDVLDEEDDDDCDVLWELSDDELLELLDSSSK